MCGCASSSNPVDNSNEKHQLVSMSPEAANAVAKAAAKKVDVDLARVVEYDYDFNKISADEKSFDKIDRVALTMIFNKYDADSSGKVGINEFRSALKEVAGKDVPKDLVKRILDAFDKDHSGGIELKEFEKMVATLKMLQNPTQQLSVDSGQEQQVKEAFRQCDQDNSGIISRTELTRALVQAGLGQKEKLTDLVLERFDTDRSGDISFVEFQKLVASYAQLITCWSGDATIADYSADVDETGKSGRVNGVVQDTNLRKEFDKYDSDGSGNIEKKELRKILKRVGVQVDKQFIDAILSVYDSDGSGKIEFSEFKSLVSKCDRCSNMEKKQNGHLKDVFKRNDENSDGKLDRAELENACRQAGLRMTTKAAQKILDQFVSDQKGEVDFKTFSRMVATCEVLNYGSDKQELHPPSAAVKRVFKQSDVDNSGFIERKELKAVFEKAGLDTSSKELKLIMTKFDDDSSGGLSLHEFSQIVDSYKTLCAFVAT